MLKFWHAEYTSRHFFFDAFGPTRDAALDALRAGLKAHGRSRDLPDDWYADEDLCAREVRMGEVYRDREPI